ncbi:MAG: biotin/lipoate A/B protein ligase family protein [Halobacteriales archaeon]
MEARLIREEARPGAVQMALEEVAADTAAAGGPATVRVYRWEPATLSLGYRQPAATVDWDACERAGIDVVRRQTGGGGIYHDPVGDISYSIVLPRAATPGGLEATYRELCTPVLEAFGRLGIDAGFAEAERPAVYEPACYLRGTDPAHDVVVGGRKISGNAQYRRREAVVQHGSLSYSLAPERHLAGFTTSATPAEFRERVTAIDREVALDRAAAVTALEGALAEWAGASEGAWREEELERARDLVVGKYRDDEWTRRR